MTAGLLRVAIQDANILIDMVDIGLLWILDQLLGVAKLAPAEAGERLLTLAQSNRRLPRSACVSRIEAWLSVSAHEAHALLSAALGEKAIGSGEGGHP